MVILCLKVISEDMIMDNISDKIIKEKDFENFEDPPVSENEVVVNFDLVENLKIIEID